MINDIEENNKQRNFGWQKRNEENNKFEKIFLNNENRTKLSLHKLYQTIIFSKNRKKQTYLLKSLLKAY